MTTRIAEVAVLVTLGLAIVGCGSESDPDPKPGPTGDVNLPDPGPNGWQLNTGTFEVPQGEEIQDCYFFEVPFDTEVWVNRITLAHNEGSHHMNVFRVRTIANLDGAPDTSVKGGECWTSSNWKDWPLVANNQSDGLGGEDWQMPEGVALKFAPREKLMLQTHYVNASTQKTPAKAAVAANFYGVEAAEVQNELGTSFATNQEIEVCPGESNRTFEASCKIAQDGPVTVIAANGHFHSRGDKFTMNRWDPLNGKGEQFYESDSWDEPPFERNLDVKLAKDEGVSWTCEFSALTSECGDPSKNCCFTFGGKVEAQEHCNAFVYYYPKGKTDKNCF